MGVVMVCVLLCFVLISMLCYLVLLGLLLVLWCE